MNRLAGIAHSLLRIVAGLVFLCHGGQKLFAWFGGLPAGAVLTPLLTTAGVIELFGGTAIVLGAFTRAAALLASGEMAVAYFRNHFPKGLWPIQNHGEPAVLLCFIFLFLAANGPGPFSLDRLRRRGPASAPRENVDRG